MHLCFETLKQTTFAEHNPPKCKQEKFHNASQQDNCDKVQVNLPEVITMLPISSQGQQSDSLCHISAPIIMCLTLHPGAKN